MEWQRVSRFRGGRERQRDSARLCFVLPTFTSGAERRERERGTKDCLFSRLLSLVGGVFSLASCSRGIYLSYSFHPAHLSRLHLLADGFFSLTPFSFCSCLPFSFGRCVFLRYSFWFLLLSLFLPLAKAGGSLSPFTLDCCLSFSF